MAAKKYDHKDIEKKWQEKWQESGIYNVPDKSERENEYVLVEFAYPSGNLHVGHWYAFSVMDIYARFRRMHKRNVLFPMGFDAFGLPAENAAIKRRLNPRTWTYENIDHMRSQLRSMGAMFDWSREVVTSDPEYYKWTQWLFLRLNEKGLAYRAETSVNWCPSCKTVLANEQVIAGVCERCDSEVEQRKMEQWLIKTTDYADRLLSDLENLPWPESIKESQRNWIGRSEGAEIEFQIKDLEDKVKIFTTRPDTIFGATYLVLAPEHELVRSLKNQISNWNEVEKYINSARKKTELERQENREKTGVELKGIKAINPATKEEIPVWISDYVLSGYGTGAIMAVPAHDKRDNEFTRWVNENTKNNIRFRKVVEDVTYRPGKRGVITQPDNWYPRSDEDWCYEGHGELVNSGDFNGRNSEESKEDIIKFVGGVKKTTYKMRDWAISRQRYWGCPIPVIHCEKCGVVAVPDKDLPVVLPEVEDYLPTGDGKSPLAKAEAWVNVKCPKCDGGAKRETDTFDTFIDSSWYFLRYVDPKNDREFASKEKLKDWIPVDFYSGGAEHTTMHLLYSRFFHKALFDLGLVNESEPYKQRMNRGLILGPDGNKMSKSKGNVIDPDDYVERLGADTVRTYLAFIGPYNEVGAYPWSPDSIIGVRRFIERVFRLSGNLIDEKTEKTEVKLHETLRDATESLEKLKMNTAVSAMMEFANTAEKEGISKEQFRTFLKILAPFAPHAAEELWQEMGNGTSIHLEEWPQYDRKLLAVREVTIVVQVNGKNRGTFIAAPDIDREEAEKAALGLPEAQKWFAGATPKRVIYVQGKLVNIVV